MLTKKEQLRKTKARNDKKLEKKDLQNYQKWLKENHSQCQARLNGCEHETVEFIGNVAVCRSCYEWCDAHPSWSSGLLLHVARENLKKYGGDDNG